MNKKILSVVMILAFSLCLIMSACAGEQEPQEAPDDLKKKIESKMEAYITDLKDSQATMDSNEKIAQYLKHWARTKGVSCREDDSGNLFMHVDSSKEYEEVQPTYIVCPYDHRQFSSYINPMALSMYCIKNNESTGDLTVIFTPEDGHDFYGAKKLKKGLIPHESSVICLNASQKGVFALETGASSIYKSTQKIKKVRPKFNKAYTITLDLGRTGQPDGAIDKVLNPITRLEAVLASLKNRNINYEISSFSGGGPDRLYASSASVTLVVDPDKETLFQERMTNETEDLMERYAEDYPELQYTFEAAEVPSKVLDKDSCNNFVNYLYTLLNGTYYSSEEGETIAITNISNLRIMKDRIEIGSVAYSLDEEELATIDEDEQTLCSLSGIQYKKTDQVPYWKGAEDFPLKDGISEAYREVTGKRLSYGSSVTSTCASYINAITDTPNMMSITVNDNITKDCAQTIITYLMDSLKTEEEKEQDA